MAGPRTQGADRRSRPVVAPPVLNPLMAKLAERAGFPVLYLRDG